MYPYHRANVCDWSVARSHDPSDALCLEWNLEGRPRTERLKILKFTSSTPLTAAMLASGRLSCGFSLEVVVIMPPTYGSSGDMNGGCRWRILIPIIILSQSSRISLRHLSGLSTAPTYKWTYLTPVRQSTDTQVPSTKISCSGSLKL